MYNKFKYQQADRFGFAAPFLLGAVTGGVAGAAFSSYPRPYQYNNYYYPYQPYPYTYYWYKIKAQKGLILMINTISLNQPYIF